MRAKHNHPRKWITRHEKKIVLENFFSLSFLQALNYILPVIALPYLIRTVGLENFGKIAFAYAFTQYFVILTDYGFNLSATREVSLCESRQDLLCSIFSSVMSAKAILVLISFVIFLLAVVIVPRFRLEWYFYVSGFGMVLGNAMFPVWFFQGREKMRHIADINVVSGIVYCLAIFLFVRNQSDYLIVPAINSLVFVLSGTMGLYVAIKRFGIPFILQPPESVRKQFKSGWGVFTSIVAINAYTATRVFAVGLLTNNTLTGFYSIAERIAGVVQTFPLTPLSQALYPRLSSIYHRNKARAVRMMTRMQAIATVSCIAALPLVFWVSPKLVGLICGWDYRGIIWILRLLLVSVLFIVANAFRVQFLLVCGRPDIFSRIHITAAIFALPMVFLGVYLFSVYGAAAVTILTEAAVFTMTYRKLRKLGVKIRPFIG